MTFELISDLHAEALQGGGSYGGKTWGPKPKHSVSMTSFSITEKEVEVDTYQKNNAFTTAFLGLAAADVDQLNVVEVYTIQ